MYSLLHRWDRITGLFMLMMTTMVGIAKISMLLLLVFLGKMATREILMQWVGVTSGMVLML